MLIVFHLPLLFQMPTWHLELQIIALYIFFWLLEDFLWFVLNPDFGIAKFKKQYIPWHPHWWWFLPREYWIFAPIAVALYLISIGNGA